MQKAKKINLLKWALRYAGRGLYVLPLHTVRHGVCSCSAGESCKRLGKHPRTQNGLSDATIDRPTIRSWWKEWPNANIGIVAGKYSDIIALDIDPRHAGDVTLSSLETELGPLSETNLALTGGGGQHRLFSYPPFEVKKDNNGRLVGPGIDVVSDRSYFVAPPSRHVSGKRYRWAKGYSPLTTRPAALPQAWLTYISDHAQATQSRPPTAPSSTGRIVGVARNASLTSMAGSLRANGFNLEAMRSALLSFNQQQCAPPLETGEVEKIARSVFRYEPSGDFDEQVMHVVLDRDFNGGAHLMYFPDGQFWRFDGRKWVPAAENWIANRILEAVRGLPTTQKRRLATIPRHVATLLKAELAVAHEDDRLRFRADPPPVVNCKNGELWIYQGRAELRQHNSESYLRHCLDVNYDPKAQCPLYEATLRGIFANAPDVNEMIRHWHELVGYVIMQRRPIPLVVILLGNGNNGKTKLIETVCKLLGDELVHASRIRDLSEDRFTVGHLLGKSLYLDDDVDAGIRLPDGELKKASEAKMLTGQQKFRPPFTFTCRAVPVLLCNAVPSIADLSYGMRRRLMVIKFDRTFRDDEDDRERFPKIWGSELPGILNLAIDGYLRVQARGMRFDPPQSVERARSEMLVSANPLEAFIKECCDCDPKVSCLLAEFYARYREWSHREGITFLQQQRRLKEKLEQLGFPTARSNKGIKVSGISVRPVARKNAQVPAL